MPNRPLSGIRACVFDAYGTLFDFASAARSCADVLAALRQAGLKTAILSNGTPMMLDAVVGGAGLGAMFDAVLSVEEVGVFKPDPRVYGLAVDRLGCPASAIAFQSSNAWDAYAASAFGMQVVWCNRYGQTREHLPGAPDCEITTLADLPALIQSRRT